ncbi:MAG: diphosphomevalonate/mevalonate 3,5-bisphosphate decarboxylase family protein [Mesonia hippocampi]|uniref:diphosphomevalonate/mevalonate 3,5-bisphosphate decarboxylase family protein n=1 Tax=Mesonia hippocampi TaxID=1628250 RepID=UPI003F9AE88C
MTEKDFLGKTYQQTLPAGVFSWQAPSNIALVKYWGKYGEQLPKNTSISFTLTNCNTQTHLHFEPVTEKSDEIVFDVFLDNQPAPDFKPKIAKFLARIKPYLSFLPNYKYKIETTNSFPHSSGIASSASGMAALSLCFMQLEKTLNPSMKEDFFYQKASFLARLGSGSAARSLKGKLVAWGEHPSIPNSSNLYGVELKENIHPIFHTYQDTILLIDKGEKTVSSTLGHQLMNNHPFAQQRFVQANENINTLNAILKKGDTDAFIVLVESEALTLHAMMMTSNPYFILMKPNTVEVIHKIWQYRALTKSKLCFTLDAGANVHLLYPENEKEEILHFINKELVGYCQNGHYICDAVGEGALKLNLPT